MHPEDGRDAAGHDVAMDDISYNLLLEDAGAKEISIEDVLLAAPPGVVFLSSRARPDNTDMEEICPHELSPAAS